MTEAEFIAWMRGPLPRGYLPNLRTNNRAFRELATKSHRIARGHDRQYRSSHRRKAVHLMGPRVHRCVWVDADGGRAA